MLKRVAWNKGLKGDEFKKHYSNGFKGTFKKGQRPHKDTEFKKGQPKPNGAYSFPKGKSNPTYKNGRYVSKGYVMVLLPEHPFCVAGGYVFEHRLVMEKHLGRYLNKTEIVHHIDKNKANNSLSNLQLFKDHSEHAKIHNAERKRDKKGRFAPL